MKYPLIGQRPPMPVQTMGRPLQNAQGMAPQPTFMQRLGEMSPALLQAGAGLLSGRTGAEQFALGAQGFGLGAQGIKEKREADLKKNKTFQWLEKNATPEELEAVRAGITTATDLFKAKTSQKAEKPSYGKNPIWGTNEAGETVLGVIGDNATFKPLDTGGFTPAPGFDEVDTGTEIIRMDKRSGAVISRTPKQNYQKAYEAGKGGVEGKAAGEAASSYESQASKLANLEQVVQKLEALADQATYTYVGQANDIVRTQLGMDPRDEAVARAEYIAVVDNQVLPLLRDTFGAAFTVQEGESLRATLGAKNKTPAEKKAVLRAFIEQKKRNLQSTGVQAGIEAPAVNGGWVDKGNGVRIRQVGQ